MEDQKILNLFRSNSPKKERYLAALVGCALGDKLGLPVEGWSRERIKKKFGKITFPLLTNRRDLANEDYSDDTILTLALAESLAAKKKIDLEDIASRQLREYELRIQPDGQVLGGFGGTTKQAFQRLQNGVSYLSSGVIGGPGNAPPMKMAPLGLYMDARREYGLGLQYAELIGKITHLDPRSLAGGVVQAQAIYSLLQDVSREEFLQTLLETCCTWEKPLTPEFPLAEDGSLASRLKWIQENKEADDETAHRHLGSNSLVYCSYPFALFMFQKYWDRPVEGLIETVNFGGDADTTGAIYGALAGARQGMVFPQEWQDNLRGKERLIRAAEGIHELNELMRVLNNPVFTASNRGVYS
jgi:ADP-ribosyl-[dinitrogen reductase] hydrolase